MKRTQRENVQLVKNMGAYMTLALNSQEKEPHWMDLDHDEVIADLFRYQSRFREELESYLARPGFRTTEVLRRKAGELHAALEILIDKLEKTKTKGTVAHEKTK